MGPAIGCPGPGANGEPGGIPNPGPGSAKCGFPPGPGPPTNGGPDEPGLPKGGPPADGEPNGPGPLNGGPALFGGGGKPTLPTDCGGPGPGVDEPDGAGDAVYWGVVEPGGGPP